MVQARGNQPLLPEQIRTGTRFWPGVNARFRLSFERAAAAQRPDGGDEAPSPQVGE